jgi:hypothetical protein
VCLQNSCSDLRLWIRLLGEPTEASGTSVHIPRGTTVFDKFLDRTGAISVASAPGLGSRFEILLLGESAREKQASGDMPPEKPRSLPVRCL